MTETLLEENDSAMRTVSNPPNPFDSEHREWLEEPPRVSLTVFEDHTREILSRNDSPDLPFRWSVNPYRGCFHACAYCYARPTHQYLGFGAGTDFDSKIVIKPEAASLLREAFMRPSWSGEWVVFSGNTDCYQPLEATYGLTRACLEVCAEFRNPVGIITKSALVVRDVDVLQQLHREAWVRVFFSIPFSSDETARKVEPQAPSIRKRFEAMARLSDAGIKTGISIAPVIPGLNDEAIPGLLSRAREAGATEAMYVLLRLTGPVETVFLERMREAFPDRVGKIVHRLQELRQGRLTDTAFFKRHHGEGTFWRMIEQLFETARRRAGFPDQDDTPVPQTFRRPTAEPAQQSLY